MNFLILEEKRPWKGKFFKILKDRYYFLMGGWTDIIFSLLWLIFDRYFGQYKANNTTI